jgi:hypothetical protein
VFQFYVQSGLPLRSREGSSSAISPEAQLYSATGKAGLRRSFFDLRHKANFVSFREPRPRQDMRQRMLHEYLRKLLYPPDEFVCLFEGC